MDGVANTLRGTFRYTAASFPTATLIGAVIVAIGALVCAVTKRRHAFALVASGLLAIALVAQAFGQWNSSSVVWTHRLGPLSYDIAGIAAAVVMLVALLTAANASRAAICLFGAVVTAVCGGLVDMDWLGHSRLPTTLHATTALTIIGFVLAASFVVAVFAILEIAKEPHKPTTP